MFPIFGERNGQVFKHEVRQMKGNVAGPVLIAADSVLLGQAPLVPVAAAGVSESMVSHKASGSSGH
jgi:hypothetical protein